MLLLTWKSRRLIDAAVQQWADDWQRRVWHAWVSHNPDLRLPDGPLDDRRGPPPREVVLVMLSALEQLEVSKRRRLDTPSLSEDEISDLESDLTYISGLSHDLRQIPAH